MRAGRDHTNADGSPRGAAFGAVRLPRALAGAGLALLLSGCCTAALAQASRFDATSPVGGQPDNPGTGQVTGSDGLPALRRGGLPDPLREGLSGGSPGGENSGGAGAAMPNAALPGLSNPGLSRLNSRVSSAASGRNPGSQPGSLTGTPSGNRGLSTLLRERAAPSRRQGTATRRITQETTQVPPPALRLSPVVRNPVVGVPLPQSSALLPLPANSAVLGLVTPGLLLANTLRRPVQATDDAYAPLGIKLGAFTFLPAFTQSLGYDSNPDQTPPARVKGSLASRSEAELAFRSDWSAAELTGELRGSYLDFPQNDLASRPSGTGVARLRVDATRDLRFDAEGRFLLDTQRTGSVDLQAATATSRPLIASYGTSLGATQTFNRLSVSLRGSVDRSEFEDAQLSDGSVIRQSDRNQNQYGLRLRTAYEISPAISPFVDLLADTRVYDLRRDTATGVRRDSDGVGISAGATFALTRFLSGEISAGLQHRTYADPTLKDIDAPILNAALAWTASPLTTVRVGAVTGITETTLAGSSGVITNAATLEVQHDLLRNLSVTLGGAYLANTYQGSPIHETGFSATARLDYRFTRWLTLRGTYLYQQLDSSVAGTSFSGNTFLLGLRVSP